MEQTPWYKTKGAIISIVAALLIGVGIGASGSTPPESTEDTNSSTNTGEVEPNTPEKEEPVAKPSEPVVLSGVGQQSTDKFQLEKGLYKSTLTHDGNGHFGVSMLNANGDYIDLLANEVGVFNGSKAIVIPSDGQYVLDISADGNWNINITRS